MVAAIPLLSRKGQRLSSLEEALVHPLWGFLAASRRRLPKARPQSPRILPGMSVVCEQRAPACECLTFVIGKPPEMSPRPRGTVWFQEARDVGQDSGKVPKEGPEMLVLRGPLGLSRCSLAA